MPIRDIIYSAGKSVTLSGFNDPGGVPAFTPIVGPAHATWRAGYSYFAPQLGFPADFFEVPDPCAERELRVGDFADGCGTDFSRGQDITIDTSDPSPLNWKVNWTMGGDPPAFDNPNVLRSFAVRIYKDDDPGQETHWQTDDFRLIPGCSSIILQNVTYLGRVGSGSAYKLDWPGDYLLWIERDIGFGFETLEVGYFGSDYTDIITGPIAFEAPIYRIRRICEFGIDTEYSVYATLGGKSAFLFNKCRRPFSMQR